MRRREDIAAHAAIARLEERVDALDRRLDDMMGALHKIRDGQRICSGACLTRIETLERVDARTMGAVDLGKWLIGGGAATTLGGRPLIGKWLNQPGGGTP
jgi:hypothetical protein